jgi:hypothetical protein
MLGLRIFNAGYSVRERLMPLILNDTHMAHPDDPVSIIRINKDRNKAPFSS